ncbi:exocyst complex component EXO70E2 [Euphorbia lathyris]|uniref:exocyst complex component EXO70E2 n=1 Tax=Euphorbia lathyris TaxID=212925 RepID=UPI00331320E4
MPTYEVEEHIVAATKHILKALEACEDRMSDDFKRAIKDIDSHLSTMEIMTKSKGREFMDIEEQLKCAEPKILQWKSNPSLIWDSGPMEAKEYLQAVNQILMVRESLEGVLLSKNGKARDISFRAQCLLQLGMSRLEEELGHILVQHKKYIDSEYLPSHSPSSVVIYDESFSSVEDAIAEETFLGDRNDRESVAYTVDLIDPHVIPHIKSIVHVMSASNYIREFCEVFISNRRDALYEYLSNLEIEKFSIEDVLKLEWDCLNSEIKKWIWAMKIIIRVYLTSEKRLCDQILGDYGSVNSFCFVEISKGSILCLLNFGQAVAMGPRKPEKLVCLLNMYEAVTDLHLEIDGIFSEDEGSLIRIEFHELLQRLVDTLTGTFLKFRNAISSYASTHPFPGGGIHPLTKYVMNYMTLLTEYCDTLNLLLKDEEVDDSNAVIELENREEVSSSCCPLARHLRSITSTLESNLVDKSKLYKDDPLQYIFLMNNMHYMVQKVKNSKLRLLFGDEWIRRHNGKFQQHATSYMRTTWGSVVSTLRDDGRTSLKERCRRFSNAFEEVYKIQTRWLIPDQQLREDLQISTSQKVIPAYRNFIGNNNNNVSERHVKYTADDLEELLLDLFVGSPRSLRNSRRR